MPIVEMRLIAVTLSPSSSNRRDASAADPGVVIAAATPMTARTATSPSVVVTTAVASPAAASRRSPRSMSLRRPNRSAIAPNSSMRLPNTTEYAPVTHWFLAAFVAVRGAMLAHRDGARIVSGAHDSLRRAEFSERVTERLVDDYFSAHSGDDLFADGMRLLTRGAAQG